MLFHIVLFRPRPNLTDAERQAFIDAMIDARRQIPSIRRFHVGQRITTGREYERAMTTDFTFAAVIEFDDLDGLRAYLEHPAHERIGRLFSEAAETTFVYDYEVREATDLTLPSASG